VPLVKVKVQLVQVDLLPQAPEGFLKVEGHSGGSAEKKFGAPHFSVVPTQFLMELGAQPSKLNNSNCHF